MGDDYQAIAHLANAYRQAQQYAPIAQQWAQHQGEFQQWLQARQEQERQAQAQQQGWWRAPEFDPRWRSQIYRDPQTGRLMTVEGADPSILPRYNAAMTHAQDFLDKFSFDPIGTIRPGIEEVVRQIAAEMFQGQMGNYQNQTYARGWVQQNSDWLHQRDPQGRLIPNGPGTYVLSPAGQRFKYYVDQAEASGIQNPQTVQEFALGMLQRDLMLAQLQGQQPAAPVTPGAPAAPALPPGEQAKADFLARSAGRQPNYGRASEQNQPRPKSVMDLQKTMLAGMAAAGFAPGSQIPLPNTR
jgi:hypothetical protein